MECVQGRSVRGGMCAGKECEGWNVCRGGVRGVVCVQGRSVRGGTYLEMALQALGLASNDMGI